jgi:starch synthase
LKFYTLPAKTRGNQIKRIMTESAERFTYEQSARQYIELYEKMLQRSLVVENQSVEQPAGVPAASVPQQM